jgi:hypothetical protein
MLLRNLDLDTLRTLVTTHDVGGFAQAADRLGRTPSAISLQMKRLQEDLGTPLLQTMQGVTLAGTVRIGAPQDRLPVLSSFPVALHRGQNVTATPATDALHSLLGMATQGVLAGLTYPQRSRILRKA